MLKIYQIEDISFNCKKKKKNECETTGLVEGYGLQMIFLCGSSI